MSKLISFNSKHVNLLLITSLHYDIVNAATTDNVLINMLSFFICFILKWTSMIIHVFTI